MGELTHAFKILSHLPSNEILQWTTGRWGFAGRCDIRLLYERRDGVPLTEEDQYAIAEFGVVYLRHIKSRSFATRTDAEKALEGIRQ